MVSDFPAAVTWDGQRLPGRVCSALGADSRALLADVGYSQAEIDQLHGQGVV